MLEIKSLETGYGKKQVLYGLAMAVRKGEIVALIGPNGAGKSTVLKAICGLIPIWKGDINVNGKTIYGFTPAQNVKNGIVLLPQGRRVFAELTIFDNLEIAGFQLLRSETHNRIAQVLRLFPILRKRSHQIAGKLSGGEQQLLAIARALIPKPELLLLDEPSLGLSPSLVNSVFDKISELNQEIGLSVLIVEQKIREVLEICNRVYSMKLGKIAFEGLPEELKEDKTMLKKLFL